MSMPRNAYCQLTSKVRIGAKYAVANGHITCELSESAVHLTGQEIIAGTCRNEYFIRCGRDSPPPLCLRQFVGQEKNEGGIMAARFLNRVAGVGSAVGIGGFLVQECIYDGAYACCWRFPLG